MFEDDSQPGIETVATGRRIMLRRWRRDDAAAVFEACQDERIQRWTVVPRPYRRSDAEWFVVDHAEDQWAAGSGAPCALVTRDGGRLVGSMGVHWFREGVAAAGYWTAPDMRGSGYTSEGLRLLCEWTFRERSVVRMQLEAEVGNAASRAVAARAGFVEEGVLRSGGVHRGERIDVVLYSLLPSDLTD